MRNKLFSLFIFIAMLISLHLLVSAHSGRTDGRGGHTDHDTGEYHYHHGYPAHDHWDMDGDGVVDCPYSFDDNVEINGVISDKDKSECSPDTSKSPSIEQTEDEKVPDILYWIIGILFIIIICMYRMIQWKNEKITETEWHYQKLARDEEARVKEGITALHEALVIKYGDNYLYAISGADEGDYIGEDGYPHSEGSLRGIGLDHYTFYLGGPPGTGPKFHHPSCRYARSEYPINATHLGNFRRYMPCMLCPCILPDISWVQRYKQHNDFLKKYIPRQEVPHKEPPLPDYPGAKINYRGRS